jgi:3,4-dihydroxy 2-butanone 4-phosphate synthase/GTP cyclohydrolase II
MEDNRRETNIKRQAEALIPTPWGNFRLLAYAESADEWMPNLALVSESFNPQQPVLTRLHSECITGDLFGSKRCDCGEQLMYAMQRSALEGGVVLYLRQEGRGIGIINKLKAYNLQDLGLNTVDANLHLGFEADERHYDTALTMLEDLGIKAIRLLTNNPDKIKAFAHTKIEIVSREPIIIEPQKENFDYLKTKQEMMGHLLSWK